MFMSCTSAETVQLWCCAVLYTPVDSSRMQAVYPSRMIENSRNATGCLAATICGISWANMTTRRQARIPVSRNIDLRDDTKTSMEVVVRLGSNSSVGIVCVLP